MEIEFRPWKFEDSDTLVAWIAEDPGILEAMRMDESTTEFAVRMFMLDAMDIPTIQFFLAERDGEAVGAVGATDINHKSASAVTHIIIPKKYQNTITAVRVAKAAVKYAFETLGFKTLIGVVPRENRRALRLDSFLGFTDTEVDVLQLTREET